MQHPKCARAKSRGEGQDLRGAVLRDYAPATHQRDGPANLSRLPLAELQGGLTSEEWDSANPDVSAVPLREAAAVHLEHANLSHACLKSASLRGAHLEGAKLEFADLDGVSLRGAHVEGAWLQRAFVDHVTSLREVALAECASVAKVCWDSVNLADVPWGTHPILGDERRARATTANDPNIWFANYEAAVLANRRLARALEAQGINDKAAQFAY